MSKKCVAVVLAAGSGKRMNCETKKQYLYIKDNPVIYYSLKTFQESDIIDGIVLVVTADDISFVTDEIVKKHGFTKVKKITIGGAERYNSVYNGLLECKGCDYVFVHDGARPFVTDDILKRAYDTVIGCNTAVVGMPVKDTIKIADENGIVMDTPNRDSIWMMQTPQCFDYPTLMRAYDNLLNAQRSGELKKSGVNVTDDAMVLETFLPGEDVKIKLVYGSYENIKITTPEDLLIAEAILATSNNAQAV